MLKAIILKQMVGIRTLRVLSCVFEMLSHKINNLPFYCEFQIIINPQKKPTSPEKKSRKNLKKFLPKLSSMAYKEGLL